MKQHRHSDIIEQVPPDYYQNGIKNNLLQRKWHMQKLVSVLAQFDDAPRSILDVGCASGWFLSCVKKVYPRADCHGVDVYKEGIKYGVKKYPKLHLKVGDAHALPYKVGTFDVVVCTEVLEHVEDPQSVLKEIKRVLKKNGILVVELDSGSILFSIVWYLWRLSKGSVWNHSHLHSFTVKKLDKMLKKAGFKIEAKKTINVGMAMVFKARKV